MQDSEAESIAQRYRAMSESELMSIARSYDELTEHAQAALRDVFQQCNLEPPLIDSDEVDIVPAETTLVTIAQYRDMPEAVVARSVLESAGIECFLRDENFVRMDWLLSNMIGGMRLQVAAEDESAARQLLSQPTPASIPVMNEPDYQQPVCPQCGSLDVSQSDSDRKVLAASMLLGIPLPFRKPSRDKWKCHHCGCRWIDDAGPE